MDIHLLLWFASMPEQLPAAAKTQLESYERPLVFSVVSLWEVAIKASLGRSDFQVNPRALRMGLLQEGFPELTIQVENVLVVQHLPWIHRDSLTGCWWPRQPRSGWTCSRQIALWWATAKRCARHGDGCGDDWGGPSPALALTPPISPILQPL